MNRDQLTFKKRRPFRRFLSGCLIVVLLVLGYLQVFGFPEWLLASVLVRARTGSFSFDARRMRLDVLRGLAFSDVKVYRKGIIGPACVEAERVTVSVAPAQWLLGRNGLRRVGVHNGVFRPKMATDPDSTQAACNFQIDFRVVLKDVLMQGVTAEWLEARVTGRGPVLHFTDIEGTLARDGERGTVSAVCAYDSASTILDGDAEVSLDPHIVLPILAAWNLDFGEILVKRFGFAPGQPPRGKLHFTRRIRPARAFAIDGRMWLENASYRGVPFLRADGRIAAFHSSTNSRVHLEPLIVVREEGVARGSLYAMPRKHMLSFNVASTLCPQALAEMIGIFTNGVLMQCTFDGQVAIDGNGMVDYALQENTRVTLEVQGERFEVPPFNFEQARGSVEVEGRTVRIEDVVGRAYGGTFSGKARLNVPEDRTQPVDYEMSAQFRNAEFESIMAEVQRPEEGEREYSGRVTGHLRMEGLIGEGMGKTVKGSGSVKIKDGKVFMLPVFGGLSRMMTRIIPGLNFLISQTHASADVEIADGAIRSRNIQIEGDVLSVTGSGSYTFDQRLDIDWQLALMRQHTLVARLLRVITYPISKLFEFHLSGTVSEPRWRPVNFSGELLQRIGLIGSDEESNGKKDKGK